MSATSRACHSPFASCLISQILEVSAVATTAQLSPCLSDQRTSRGAPGTARTCFGVIAFRSHTTMVLPKRFIASASCTSLPNSIM